MFKSTNFLYVRNDNLENFMEKMDPIRNSKTYFINICFMICISDNGKIALNSFMGTANLFSGE